MNGIRFQNKLIQASLCLDELFDKIWLDDSEKHFLNVISKDYFIDMQQNLDITDHTYEYLYRDKKYYPLPNKLCRSFDVLNAFTQSDRHPPVRSIDSGNWSSGDTFLFPTSKFIVENIMDFFVDFQRLSNAINGGAEYKHPYSILNKKLNYEDELMFSHAFDKNPILVFEDICGWVIYGEPHDYILDSTNKLGGVYKGENYKRGPDNILINFSKNTDVYVLDGDTKHYLKGRVNLINKDIIGFDHRGSTEIETIFMVGLNSCEHMLTRFFISMLLFSYSLWSKK